jgi:hypothetical protein
MTRYQHRRDPTPVQAHQWENGSWSVSKGEGYVETYLSDRFDETFEPLPSQPEPEFGRLLASLIKEGRVVAVQMTVDIANGDTSTRPVWRLDDLLNRYTDLTNQEETR